MDELIRFMKTPVGRGVRALLGLALIVYGLFGLGGVGGVVLAVVGLVPLYMGLSGGCLLEMVTRRGNAS